MRWTSKRSDEWLLTALTTSGPKEMLGTNCPSMISRWSQSAVSTDSTSSLRRLKSAAKIEGAILTSTSIPPFKGYFNLVQQPQVPPVPPLIELALLDGLPY